MNERGDFIAASLQGVKERIHIACHKAGRDPMEITLISVTKNFPASDVQILYDLGERNFGENRDQEAREKSAALPSDAIWHFQGQIQSKKLRSITGWADVIHSLDDISHAGKIAGLLLEKSLSVFVQVSLDATDGGDGRGGVEPARLTEFLRECARLPGLELQGLMAVAPLAHDPAEAFFHLAALRREVAVEFPQLVSLSCGMSGDFEAAIAAGATHIRVGSSILGSR